MTALESICVYYFNIFRNSEDYKARRDAPKLFEEYKRLKELPVHIGENKYLDQLIAEYFAK